MVRILYVEDDKADQELVCHSLHSKNYEVILAQDGLEGVRKACNEKPDLILMHMGLPVLDGWEAASQIKSNPKTCLIPIIALIPHNMPHDQDKALKSGCDDYHAKPINIEQLQYQIVSLLKKKQEEKSREGATLSPLLLKHAIFRKKKETSVLVVDDDEEIRDILSCRLCLEGFNVITAENGPKAMEYIKRGNFDLVLLDLLMPEINGMEILHFIREKYSLGELPVIIVTVKDTQEDLVKALKEGANDYITKPIDMSILLARIHTHLNLHRLSLLKDEFMSIASHDLRNPLGIIYGYIWSILNTVHPGMQMTEEAYSYLIKIKKSAENMKHIISDFLNFQALEEGQFKLDLGPVDINNLLLEATEEFQGLAREKNISIRLEPDEGLKTMNLDSGKITQVIQNLVNNAIKFSPPETRITIRSFQEQTAVLVEVSDMGKGLNPEDMSKIFEKYERLRHKDREDEKGYGLGLAICKKLVEAHDGEIGVRNNPDQGATFWFRLPV